MQTLGDYAMKAMEGLGSESHVPANPGDTIGADGMLHCGICGQKKEFKLPFNGRYVPSLCQCGKDALAREEAEKQRRDELQRVRDLASYSLVDERFHESTFERFVVSNPQDERIFRICRNYVKHFDEMLAHNAGLIFYGDPGTGKTFAASCIANALMAKGVPVLVTSIVRLTANMFGDDLNDLLDRMNTARLLVLDDFGAERDTPTKAEQVFTVIDARYAAKKPMIITTNLTDFKTEDNVRRKRVYDRIFEVCTPIKVDGESKRRAEGHKKRNSIRDLLEE